MFASVQISDREFLDAPMFFLVSPNFTKKNMAHLDNSTNFLIGIGPRIDLIQFRPDPLTALHPPDLAGAYREPSLPRCSPCLKVSSSESSKQGSIN